VEQPIKERLEPSLGESWLSDGLFHVELPTYAGLAPYVAQVALPRNGKATFARRRASAANCRFSAREPLGGSENGPRVSLHQ
jgi:hypothetical protein